jgi:hypothetical protein
MLTFLMAETAIQAAHDSKPGFFNGPLEARRSPGWAHPLLSFARFCSTKSA